MLSTGVCAHGKSRLIDRAASFPATYFVLRVRLLLPAGEELASIFAAADVFVFPSRTDTFGLVMLEALASGVPVAAYPVAGPRDAIGDAPIGALDADLRAACLRVLTLSRQPCREFALMMSWHAAARQFLANIVEALPGNATSAAA